ncbi:denticleless protein homolog isoform X2 [Myotis lucifugus]|uniref:denticleless protein homolog isoform X2 n=2 Tax=Myotis lucifugus TaxID=59463 RepID=UPI000CCC2CDC|nr:denticleless protein homolog isoform X2 [Myotis lucifugus]
MLFNSVLRQPQFGVPRHGWSSQYPLQSLLTGYQCNSNDEHTSYGETGVPVPPFGCTFSSAPNMKHILAVANEEGFVRLYNTESQTYRKKCVKEWMAHWNAVFDLAWVPGEFKLLSSVQVEEMATLWSGTPGVTKKDSQQSVTVVLFQDENTLVSAGAVDGVIKIWDLRKNYTAYRQEPIASKYFLYPGSSTRKLGYSSLILDSTGSTLFANCTDDNIYMFNMTGLKTSPVAVFNGHQNSTFYIKSSLSPDDQFLISGSSDEAAYIWKVSTPWHPPTLLLGHSQEVTSVCWCPSDFTKIATCSDDNTLKIWRLNRGLEEKSGDKLSTVGWASQKKKEARADPVTVTNSQSTPAKAPRVKSSPSSSSPSSASCAPSCAGDLPLPSNTPTFSIKTSPGKARSPISRRGSISSISPKPPSSFKMSIRHWITQTPSSSPPITPPASETKITSPRKALIPVSLKSSQAVACSESRNRVKRRLDSSCLENVKQKCVKSCSCVTELDDPVEKLHLDLCCLTGNQEDLGKDSLGSTKSSKIEGASMSVSEPPSPASPYASEGCGTLPLPLGSCGEGSELVGKENSSPENKNWLLAMAAKRKAENSSPRSPSSQTSNSRRQSGKTSPGPVTITPNSMRKICTYFHRKSQDDYCSPERSTEL